MNDDIEIDEPLYMMSNEEDHSSPNIIDSQKSPEIVRDTVSNIDMEEPTPITVKAVSLSKNN